MRRGQLHEEYNIAVSYWYPPSTLCSTHCAHIKTLANNVHINTFIYVCICRMITAAVVRQFSATGHSHRAKQHWLEDEPLCNSHRKPAQRLLKSGDSVFKVYPWCSPFSLFTEVLIWRADCRGDFFQHKQFCICQWQTLFFGQKCERVSRTDRRTDRRTDASPCISAVFFPHISCQRQLQLLH